MRIHRLLIANRGEIACRIIRSCQRLGIESVLAVSDADIDSLAARQADKIIAIGPAPSLKSYLNIAAIVDAATSAQVDAVHPGYGFLAENVGLATALEQAGIIFIGPTPAQLSAVGDKLSARKHALEAGLRVVPGAAIDSPEQAVKIAAEIAYPILIKAVSGGGGRGLKRVEKADQMEQTINLAMAEADASCGDSRVYLERYIVASRHVEVQILGDGEKVIHLGDRDCSIQRRYQKLLEEAPAPDIDSELRTAMYSAAVMFAQHLKYKGAGTVEFLVDCQSQEFYFLEMNARIQVEHPVTEIITGVDLVEEQILIAEGRPLRYRQEDIGFAGHAIECRINAEDIANDFQPCPGTIEHVQFPVGSDVRIDTHIEAGVTVPSFYDSLLLKIICHGENRKQAISNMLSALERLKITGVKTNTEMHSQIMQNDEFIKGGVLTSFFPEFMQTSGLAKSGGTHG